MSTPTFAVGVHCQNAYTVLSPDSSVANVASALSRWSPYFLAGDNSGWWRWARPHFKREDAFLGGANQNTFRITLPGGAGAVAKELLFSTADEKSVRLALLSIGLAESWDKMGIGVPLLGVGYRIDLSMPPAPNGRLMLILGDFLAKQNRYGRLISGGAAEAPDTVAVLRPYSVACRQWVVDRILSVLAEHPDPHLGNVMVSARRWTTGDALPPEGTYWLEKDAKQTILVQVALVDPEARIRKSQIAHRLKLALNPKSRNIYNHGILRRRLEGYAGLVTERGIRKLQPPGSRIVEYRGKGVVARVDASIPEALVTEWMKHPDKPFDAVVEKVFKTAPRTVSAVRISDRSLIWKEYPPSGAMKSIAALLVDNQATRAWKKSRMFEEEGIPTPKPIAFVETYRFGVPDRAHILFERDPAERTAWEQWETIQSQGELTDEERAARRAASLQDIARCFRELHGKNITHGDSKSANILVGSAQGGRWIDLADARKLRSLSDSERAHDLSRFYASLLQRSEISPAERHRFFEAYFAGGPEDAQRRARIEELASAEGQRLWERFQREGRRPQ